MNRILNIIWKIIKKTILIIILVLIFVVLFFIYSIYFQPLSWLSLFSWVICRIPTIGKALYGNPEAVFQHLKPDAVIFEEGAKAFILANGSIVYAFSAAVVFFIGSLWLYFFFQKNNHEETQDNAK